MFYNYILFARIAFRCSFRHYKYVILKSHCILQRTEEERRKAAEEERVQLEMEEKKAWEALQIAQERKAELGQILETERQEAERKAEVDQLEAERQESEKVAEQER